MGSSTNVVNLWKVAFLNTVAKEARVGRMDTMKEDSVARVAKVALALALPLVMVAREANRMVASKLEDTTVARVVKVAKVAIAKKDSPTVTPIRLNKTRPIMPVLPVDSLVTATRIITR